MSGASTGVSVILIEPWPADGIESYRHMRTSTWGMLLFYADNTFDFDDKNVPTDEAIFNRWGKKLLEKTEFGALTSADTKENVKLKVLFNGESYFIGCPISPEQAIVEGAGNWDTQQAAEMSLLTNEWARADKLTYAPIVTASE